MRLKGAFDAEIIVYSPTSSLLNWTDKDPSGSRPIPHTRVNSLEEMLAIADVVSLHCPLLPETHDMMSTEQFKLMKHDAILINTSRGGMVCSSFDKFSSSLRVGNAHALHVFRSMRRHYYMHLRLEK